MWDRLRCAPDMRVAASACLALGAICVSLQTASRAAAYGWPVKPFNRQHALRGTFGDPRYHQDAEGQLSAFHFGVDIVAPDGAPVYAVEPGIVVRRHTTSLTIGRPSGRRFGYWHVRPVVRSGTYVRLHQLLGHVIAGWGHVHFAESVDGSFRNPLRKGALAPYADHTAPVIAAVQILRSDGSVADPGHVSGIVAVTADVYDPPALAPPPPWDVARFAPSTVSWTLTDAQGVVVDSSIAVNFERRLPPNRRYGAIYGPGTYQNKPHRPGQYVFWLAHRLDTTRLPNGSYTFDVLTFDTRNNSGRVAFPLAITNGVG